MHSSTRVAAVLSAVVLSLIMAPGAGAADWLPAFDLQADSAVDVEMTPGGDVAIVVIADGQYGFRFRPAGGPLGPLERPFPAGADGAKADVDAQGNTYFVWRSAGTVEARVRSRDGNLSAVQTIQAAGIGQDVAVTDDGRATLIWLSNDANRVGSARTRAANGDLGVVHQVTVTGETTRDFHVDVDAEGNAAFAWTTPDAPPRTETKARWLFFEGQTLSGVQQLSGSPPPAPSLELFDEVRVAVDATGKAIFVWRHSVPAFAQEIETRTIRADGVLLVGPTSDVTTPGFTGQAHAVATDDLGNARITWSEHPAGDMTAPFIPKTCFTTNFSSCGARLDLSTEQSLATSVAMSPAGDSFVGYASPAGQVRVIPGPAGGVPSTHILSPTARVPALAADAEGNAIAVWSETAGGYMAAGYDAAPPQITGVTFRPSPSAASRWARPCPCSTSGAQARAGPSATAARRRGHRSSTRSRAPERSTCRSPRPTASAPPPSPLGQVTVTDTRAPELGRVTMSRKRFRLGRTRTPASSQRKRRAPRGTAFRFDLGEAATVRIALQRARKGRRVRGRCRAAAQGGPASPSLHALREEPDRAHAHARHGRHSVPFTGRVGRRKLAPGTISRDRHRDRRERQRLSRPPGGLQGRALETPQPLQTIALLWAAG